MNSQLLNHSQAARRSYLREQRNGLTVTIVVGEHGKRSLLRSKPSAHLCTHTRLSNAVLIPDKQTIPKRHRQYGETYVALQWSESLAAESKAWAQNLAEQCKLKHDFSISYGENLALDWSWGNEMKPTDNILARESMSN